MTCPSCRTELRDTAKFCPHCGAEAFQSLAAHSTYAPSQGAAVVPAPESQDIIATKVITAYGSQIPKTYSQRLAGGAPPESLIEELLRRYARFRALVEKATLKLPQGNAEAVTEGLKTYLRSHCEVCGERLQSALIGQSLCCEGC